MIVNAYSVVAAFTSALELVLGAVALVGAWRIVRRARSGSAEPGDAALGLFLPGVVLALLAVASVPLLGLLLQSYVPQWPGVMCVRGVLRIGTGSRGAAGLLPTLLGTLAATKPLLVFAAGAWVTVHLVNRATRTAPLARTVLLLVAASGALAVLDASAETAYLLIPKQERFLASGCCTIPQSATAAPIVAGDPAVAAATFFGLAALAAAAVVGALRGAAGSPVPAAWAVVAAASGAGAVGAGGPFLADVLSPPRSAVAGHPCAYCLLADAPEFALGAALAAAGAFAAAWAATAVLAARGTGAETEAAGVARRLLRVAAFALPAAAAMGLVGWRFA